MGLVEVIEILLLLVFMLVVVRSVISMVLVPLKLQNHFKRQGISGPKYRPVFGNAKEVGQLHAEAKSTSVPFNHDVLHKMVPHYTKWAVMYGKTFLYWFGSNPRLVVSDPQMAKEVMTNASGSITKIEFNPLVTGLVGRGVATIVNNELWARRRRIVNQGFTMECIKNWVPQITTSATNLLQKWEGIRGGREEFELDVFKEFHELSADIVSRTVFGSSYEKGKQIFELQEKQMHLVSKIVKSVYIPGYRFFPTKDNRERGRLEKETCDLIKRLIIQNHKFASENTKSVLSILMASHKGEDGVLETLSTEEIIDECKGFYFAGKETVASSMTWTLLLLALHQDWQDKAREEVVRVFGSDSVPVAEKLKELKTIQMIISETLRLYPIVVVASPRRTTRRMKLGNLDIPAGTQFEVQLAAIQRDTDLWGADANEFNPSRFNEPRKHLAAYFPFGLGPRICVGQNLYIHEFKIVLASILRQYTFRVSPTYVHSPYIYISLEPKNGAHILFTKISP